MGGIFAGKPNGNDLIGSENHKVFMPWSDNFPPWSAGSRTTERTSEKWSQNEQYTFGMIDKTQLIDKPNWSWPNALGNVL